MYHNEILIAYILFLLAQSLINISEGRIFLKLSYSEQRDFVDARSPNPSISQQLACLSITFILQNSEYDVQWDKKVA